jgi:hypothetical protein
MREYVTAAECYERSLAGYTDSLPDMAYNVTEEKRDRFRKSRASEFMAFLVVVQMCAMGSMYSSAQNTARARLHLEQGLEIYRQLEVPTSERFQTLA